MIRYSKIIVLAAFTLLVPAAAHAQLTIYACVNSSSGTVKIVDAATTCKGNDMKVQWDVAGPQGPQGPAGPTNVFGLTVSKTGTGKGLVTSADTGIVCDPDCTEVYPAGTQVTLTARPDNGSTFVGWSGDCAGTDLCTLTLSATRAVTAQFDAAAVALPDLVPFGLSAAITSTVVNVLIRNQGTAPANGIQVNVRLFSNSSCSGPFVGFPTANVPELGAGVIGVTGGAVPQGAPGVFSALTLEVDPNNLIQESNETNNVSPCFLLAAPIVIP